MSNIARFALLPIAIAQFAAPALPALGFGETIGAGRQARVFRLNCHSVRFSGLFGRLFLAHIL